MTTRNFWFEADVDGRSTRIASGPAGEDGGLSATFYVRCEGSVITVATVRGRALPGGGLLLYVEPALDGTEPDAVTLVPYAGNGFIIRSKR